MSANLVVDLGNTTQTGNIVSIDAHNYGDSGIQSASGIQFGNIIDMIHADTYCNLNVVGRRVVGSGQLRVQGQVSPTTASGDFYDWTSGRSVLPGAFTSGGILTIGGTSGGLLGPAVSGQNIQSGFSVSQGFIRTDRYVRAMTLADVGFAGPIHAQFISQLKVTGSGGGTTQSPLANNTIDF
mgnify:CR=1 FL=1